MSATLNDGFGGYLVLLAIAVLAHEPWRWAGFLIGRHIDSGSELFLWVRAVATALVAALVMKLVVFPAGALAAVPAWIRGVALFASIGIFLGSGRKLGFGIAGGAAALILLQIVAT